MSQMRGEVIDCSEWTLDANSNDNDTDDGTQENGNISTNGPLLENLPDRHLRRVPLPLELNCQIFECLKFGIQRKIICGLGRGIYEMFRQKVLKKSKRLRNPEQNSWELSNTAALISSNGLSASHNTGAWSWEWELVNVFAQKGYPITGELSRKDNFPGTILYYFEVTITSSSYEVAFVGLSSGNIPDGTFVGNTPNTYAFPNGCYGSYLSGRVYRLEWPNDTIEPEWNYGKGGVVGCGLLLSPKDKLSIFFTVNGLLMGKSITINSTVGTLYPTVSIGNGNISIEANFGEDSAKPFCYDCDKCPGMNLE